MDYMKTENLLMIITDLIEQRKLLIDTLSELIDKIHPEHANYIKNGIEMQLNDSEYGFLCLNAILPQVLKDKYFPDIVDEKGK